MVEINTGKILSMTELQKLSLKKLRKSKPPLFVIDRKAKKGGFVILDYESYERLQKGSGPTPEISKKIKSPSYDFRAQGIFWDRPEMTNQNFMKILKDPSHPENVWAVTRILERLPSQEILSLFPLSAIEAMLKRAKVRDFIRRPWEHALEYYRQKTPGRR